MRNDDRDGQTLRIYAACPQCGVQMRVPNGIRGARPLPALQTVFRRTLPMKDAASS